MKRFSTLFVFFLLASFISHAQPSTQASNILIAPVSAVGSPTQMQFYWTPGTGANKVIVVVSDLTSTFTPTTNQTYTANTDFAAGADIGIGSGKSVCVFNNTSSTGTVAVTFTAVTYGNDYVVQIFEYTGAAGAENYNRNLATRNPITYKAFTSTGSWTPPSGITSALVQTWGGGGGGGANTTGNAGNGGSGGGGGAYSSGVVTGLSASAKTITVGNGGAGVQNTTTTNAGGDSWFGPDGNVANALVLAKGGGAGASSSTATPTNGGASTSGLPVAGGVRVSGGNGSAGEDQAGGGGGSSGGPGLTGSGAAGISAIDGNAGNQTTGGIPGGPIVGGGGGSSGQNEADNSAMPAAAFPGGGGGGTQDSNTSTSSSGGGGLVIVSHSAPGIVSATLDYNTGILVVTLTEPVSGLSDIDETKFHINNTTGTDVVNLADPEATGFSGNTITFTLTEAHRLAALAISGTTGGNGGAVVLDVDAGGVMNSQGNVNSIDDNNPVTETVDTTKPTITSAILNYGTGVLVVTLSEGLKDINGIDATKFHLNDATGTDNVTLTNGERTSIDQANKTITFTLSEANRLAALALSGVTGGNGGAVVLDVDAAGVTDAATNTNNIDDNNTVTETADTVAPSIVSATIDYNTGVMVVTLTEGVANVAAVDGTKFHINNISGTDLINLTNGEVTSVNTGARTATFTLTEVHRIAAIAISGTTGGDGGAVKLDVDAGGLTDPRSNANAADIDNTTPTETVDSTKPTVTSAILDYGTGILVVTLSEGLKDINGLNGALFHLNDATGTDNVTLSNAERTSVDQANKTVTFTLTNSNRLAALALSGVAGGNGGAVVLDVDAAGVTDAAANTNNIDDNNAVAETADTTAPTILSASINYGTGVMVVTLSEGVANTAAVDATKFHINNITGTDLINLTVGELTSVNTGAATVTFTLTEVHRIAAIAISGTTGGDGGAAKLDADIGALTDPQANSNAAAIDNTTLTETADSVNPTVTSATLNYGTGVLVVTLSEGVKDINALDGTKFHLNDATGTDNVTLSNGERTSVDQATKTVTFTLSEANRGAALLLSGTTGGNGGAVVLDVDAGGVTDAANNANTIDDNNPVTESADAVAPTVTSATLDYGTGILVVTFSEGIPLASVDATKFHINNTTGSDAVTLSAGEKTSANLGARTVTFTLSETNRLAALAISGVAGGDGGAVVLDVDASGIADVATNALAADDDNNTVTETADTVAPSVASAAINYGTGVLVVTLTEGVANTAAVTASEFHINNITGTDNITLTNGELTSVNTAARTITFTLTEANRVAALALSGTAGGDGGAVKLDVDAAAFTDPRGNANAADIDNTTPTETADSIVPVASAPTSVAQRLKTGATSTSTVASNESASIIYLVKNGVAAGTTGQITTAIGANNAFQVQANANKDQAYTVTVPASVNDGTYDIVVVDKASNVSVIVGGWLYIDNTAPTVAITRQTATPTNLTTLNFDVTFDEGVTGVDVADFLLQTGNANDATGTISITPNSASSYTVQVSSVVGQNAGGVLSVLNLDFAGVNGIQDLAANAFAGSFTEEEYEVDNTAPGLSPDQMLLKDNGVAVETITFSLSEELNVAEGGSVISGFSTSTGTIASAIYTGKGSTNKVTLTSSANGQWTSATTVSYSGAGGFTDMIGNLLPVINNHIVIQPVVNLVAGDVAFTSVRSDDTDQFSVVLLRSVPVGTQIYFTDRGWNSTTSSIEDSGSDGLFIWTATAAYNAGTEIKFLSNGSNVFSSSLGSVANDAEKVAISAGGGDEILAYQTDGSSITFVGAIKFADGENWEADGDPDGGNESAVPAGLSASHYLLLGDYNNGAYRRTGTATSFTGSTTELRALVNNTTNWDRDNDPNNVDLPGNAAPNDGTAWAAFSPNSVTYVIRPKINSVSIPNVAMKVGSAVTATINVDDDAALTPISLTSGTIGGFTLGTFARTNATTYTAQFTVAEGGTDVAAGSDVPVANLVLQNSLGNSNPAFAANVNPAGNADAIDAKSPKVVSLVRQTATTTQFGTSAANVVFRMTFVSAGTASPEDIQISTLTATDFSIPVTGSVTGAAVTGVAAVSTGVYDITVGNYSGTGTLGLNYRDSEVNVAGASVLDLAGNPTITAAGTPDGSVTGEVYSIVLPEPGAGGAPIPVTVSAFSSNSITVQWSGDATTPLPTHYLVLARLTSAGVPVVGTDVADFTYQIDDVMVQNVTRVAGTHSAQFTGLASGTSYSFYVFKYALSDDNAQNHIDFQYANFGQVTQVTSTAALSWVQSSNSIVTIPSIKNASTNSVGVLEFTIYDDGLDPLVPNIMSLSQNGLGPETIQLTLRGELTLAENAAVTGFTSSTGSVVSAVYTGKGTTNTILLTNGGANGSWTAGTTIDYNATAGNMVFTNTAWGPVQSIIDHVVTPVAPVVLSYTAPGLTTFNVPSHVTQVTVEVWGAGGSGGPYLYNSSYDGGASSGGGGGGYSRKTMSVTPNGSYSVFVGAGGAGILAPLGGYLQGNDGQDTYFGSPSTVMAKGGRGGWNNDWTDYYGVGVMSQGTNSYGGQASAGVGDVKYSGGNGGVGYDGGAAGNNNGVNGWGGGGGSSAGTGSNGNAGSNGGNCCSAPAGGLAPTGGGAGGSGSFWFNATGGFAPGGGGGGNSGDFDVPFNFMSGSGATGRVVITYPGAHPTSGGTKDWDSDNSPFKMSSLTITQAGGNTPALNDWRDIIEDAELTDGTSPVPADGTINATSITFPTIAAASATDVGYITDATTSGPSSKTFTLKIWLRDDLDPTLAATVDGMSLAFQFNPTSIVYDDAGSQSSRLVSPQLTHQSGVNPIEVDASQLLYRAPGRTPVVSTQPPAQIGVMVPFSANVPLQDPAVYALDANFNLDTDFAKPSGQISITNPSFGQSIPAPAFVAGKLDLNSFRFTTGTTIGTPTQITVSTSGTPVVTPISSTDVVPHVSSLTTISAGPGAEPSFFSSLATSQASAVQNFDFTLTDDVGANTTTFADNDALPTILTNVAITQHTDNGAVSGGGDPEFDLWLRSIAGAELSRATVPGVTVLATVTNTSLNFDLTTLTPAQITSFATITDGGNATFRLRVWLNGPVDASLRTIIDGLDLVFNVDTNGLIVASGSQSSFVATGENLNSGNNNNQIEVDATSLIFAQDFSGALSFATVPPTANSGIDYLVNTSATTLGYSNPIVEAVDSYGLRDTDYSAAVTTANGDALGVSNQLTSLTAGVGTFSGGFLYTAVGDGTLSVSTATGNRVGFVPTATTNGQPINVRTGKATTFDVASTVVSSPIASIVNAAPGFTVLKFRVDDDPAGTPGPPMSENDGNPTLITGMIVSTATANNTIVDWREAIAGARLEDAGNAAKFVDLAPATQIGANTLTFTSIPTASGELGFIADNSTKEYNLRIWLKTNLAGTQNYDRIIDGLEFGFNVLSTNVTTSVNGTSFTSVLQQPNAASGASTVEVTATQIDIVNPLTPASASLEVPLQVQLEARDVNGNLDLGFNGTITSITNNSSVTMQSPKGFDIDAPGSDIQFGVTAFSGGLYNLPYTTTPSLDGFQYTSGSDDMDVSLDISAGGINTLTSFGPKYPEIKLKSSFESILDIDPAFVHVLDIPYEVNQDINSASTSFALEQFKLTDGDGTNADDDGAATNILNLTLSITPATSTDNIESLAVYKGNTFVQSKDNADFAAGSVTFDNLSTDLIAPDGGSLVFTIRASFYNTPAAVTDNDPIKLAVTAVSQLGGSQFLGTIPAAPLAGYIGGVNGGAQGATHQIEVTATSLDFTTQASLFAGINEPIGLTYTAPPLPSTSAAVVQARDKFAVIDLDFDVLAPSVTGAVAIASSNAAFVDGVLNLNGMTYTSTGNGTLTVAANGLSSATIPPDNIGNYIPASPVNVVHVQASYPTSGLIEGDDQSNPADLVSLKGGTLNAFLFGVTFTPQNATGSHPLLTKFTFEFDRDYTGTFDNFSVLEVTSGGTFDVENPSIGGTLDLSIPGRITVNLNSKPRELYNGPLTYYLVADVDPGADLTTAPIKPRFADDGYGSTTNSNIVVSNGTAVGNFEGHTYTFASTKPPILQTTKNSQTVPYAGQLNVPRNLPYILLEFDTKVGSLDGGLNGGAEIYNRKTKEKVADLVAPMSSGNFLFTSDYTDVINPLKYEIDFVLNESTNQEYEFEPDEVYYILIKQGSFSNQTQTGTGIADKGLNYFGGISSNSTLSFKIASDKPVLLSAVEGRIYSPIVASISTNFDQFGTAYYMVLPQGSPEPTEDEVKNPSTYGAPAIIKASGNYEITQINQLQTVAFQGVFDDLMIDAFDVYVTAENDALTFNAPNIVPSPLSAGGVYGSNLLAAGGGPTLQFTYGGSPVTPSPTYLICPNSFVLTTDPIIIAEETVGKFSSVSEQDFNLLLPSGYSFDLSSSPTVQLIGPDFTGAASISFESNSVLKVSYNNLGSSGIDYFVINNLKILGQAGSNSAYIKRFYGKNTSFTNPTADLATVEVSSPKVPGFDNSYNRDNRNFFPTVSQLPRDVNPISIPDNVTAIPDNYIDDETTANTIRLLPQITTPNDYGASIFTGTGVTNDILTLSAVAKDAAFNITMNHVDPNGCVLQNTQQYLVYDHLIPVSEKLGTTQALANTAFPGVSPGLTSATINYDDLASYRLVGLTADLPARVLKGKQEQIMSGDDWREVVKRIPNPPTVYVDGAFGQFFNYTWDYSHVLNADTEQGGTITLNPYFGDEANHFDATTNRQNKYWKGGSLGQVEFTGVFQSQADLQVVIPFRQYVELFVPAIPLIEVSSAGAARFDNDDQTANNLDGTVPEDHINLFQYPTDANNNSLYPGTTLFCEANGNITLNGYPAALSGTSVGTFAIFDYKSYDFSSSTNVPLVTAAPGSAFVDNLNGTATLDPTNPTIKNNYDDILITYTYQQNNSPAKGIGYLIIRVVPNPEAQIITTSLKTSKTLYQGSDFCEGIPITFDASGSTLAAGGKTGNIDTYTWNFGDGGANVFGVTQTHAYETSLVYPATLTVRSTYGCESATEVASLRVGAIPEAEFTFSGVSTADDISFENESTLSSSPTVNDSFDVLSWAFDFVNSGGNTLSVTSNFDDPVSTSYATAGVYTVNLNVSSKLGCASEKSHNIIVLPRRRVTDTDAYDESFESGDGEWQTNALNNTSTSWAFGTPAKAVVKTSPENGNNIWVTNLTGFYDPKERSALYSPSFDLSSLERPMISFDHFTHLAAGEGVAIEFSTDNKNVADPTKNWVVLGVVNPTLGWYNANGLSSQPGFENFEGFGWSSEDTEWSESKYVLDDVLSQPNVVFRFALSTLTDVPNKDGFAVDNVRVGNRTRTVLVENFKNLGNNAGNPIIERAQSEKLKTFKEGAIGTKLVKVNYHVGFPQQDPFNLDNPQDPSSRALYYNVKATPVVRMDGEGEEGLFSSWGEKKYDVQTLKLANARIDINVKTNLDGSLSADVTVTSVSKALPAQSTILQVAVVEKSVALSNLPQSLQELVRTGEVDFEFVVKKMLPTAAGTRFTQTLTDGKSEKFTGFTWTPDRTRLYTTDNLAVVAFIQDEATREVYQAEIQDLGTDPPAVTGLENGLKIEDVILHPNPADHEVTVRLPRNAVADVDIQMIDQAGRTLQTATLPKGERATTLNVRDLPSSVYLLKLTENGRVTYKRAMVVHRN